MANPFVHIELQTQDPGKAKAFYAKLLQWKLEDMDMGPGGTYTMIKAEGGPGGGMMKTPMPNTPSMWIPYIGVDDVAKSTATAKELGATVYKEKTEIPGMGFFSIVADPTGAVLGLFEAVRK
jgi:predicted enzyme related to lactoylglutathione lyase